MSGEMKSFYRARSDVRRLPFHLYIDILEKSTDINTSFSSQIDAWLKAVKLADIVSPSASERSIARADKQGSAAFVSGILASIRDGNEDCAFAPLDRDVKRAACMDVAGYAFRMHNCFMAIDEFYKTRPDLSSDDAIERRTLLMFDVLPKRLWLRFPLVREQLAHAYLNYKGKCLHDVGEGFGLKCPKDHSHEREVIASCRDPLCKPLARCGRALRLAVKLAKVPGWTL